MDNPLHPQASKQQQQQQQAGLRANAGAWAPLLAQAVELLAEQLAPRLAAELAHHQPTSAPPPTRRLLSLDQLVELFPTGRSPATWKRWLYQRTRNGQVPGASKIGGRLYFDPEQTIPWLTGDGERLDVADEQSFHQPPMPSQPPTPRQGG